MKITSEQIKTFDEKIRNAENIIIFAHKNPDGDALCSVMAMGHLIYLNYGKEVVCMYDGNVPDNLDETPMRRRFHYFERVSDEMPVDVAIVMDYGAEHNVGGIKKFLDKAKYVIEFDHHINDTKIGNLCIDDDTAAATGEIIYEFMRAAGLEYDDAILQLLATAIITDTGLFRYVKHGNVMRVIGEMVDEGVNIQRILNDLANKPRKTIVTEAGAVAEAEFLFHHRLAIATINNKQYRNLDGRGETVLSLLGQIHGVDYIVLLKEQNPERIGVSLRGRFRAVDKIAVELGGGGHEFAAGAVVSDTLDNVKKRVIELFRKVIK